MKFENYHPGISLIYFVTVFVCTFYFLHSVFLALSFVCGWITSLALVKRKGFFWNLCWTFFAVVYAAYYASYEHFGVTVLWYNRIGNAITLEALAFGITKGVRAAAVGIWSSYLFSVFTTDKITYLLGKISPYASLFFSLFLRMLPKMKIKLEKIRSASQGIGRKRGIRRLSSLMLSVGEDLLEASSSMKSRGFSLKGRTVFSVYSFENRDRGLVILMFLCITLLWMAGILEETRILFDPVIEVKRMTNSSFFFYGVYAFFLLLPVGLEGLGEWRWKRCIRKTEK